MTGFWWPHLRSAGAPLGALGESARLPPKGKRCIKKHHPGDTPEDRRRRYGNGRWFWKEVVPQCKWVLFAQRRDGAFEPYESVVPLPKGGRCPPGRRRG